MSGESDLIDTVDVADGIAIPVQHHGRHSLLLSQLLNILRELLDLTLQTVARWRRVIMQGQASAYQQDDCKHGFEKPGPFGRRALSFRL